jgi:hypothetical protein
MRIINGLLFLLLLCFGCKNTSNENNKKEVSSEIKFDATKWKIKTDKDYPFREAMLNDLISPNQLKCLKSLKKDQILALLGPPDRVDKNYLFYLVSQEHLQFFPLHTTTLVVKLSSNKNGNLILIHR